MNCHRASKSGDTRNAYPLDKKRRNHLLQLRSITAKLLREDSDVRTTSISGTVSTNITKNKTKSKGISIKAFNNANKPKPCQKITPWVESSATVDVEASPIEILAVSRQRSDELTEHTTLCSAFELLSFDNFCSATTTGGQPQSGQPQKSIIEVASAIEPLKIISVSPAKDDYVVPREISFMNQNICGGCTSDLVCSPMPVNVVKRQRSRNTKQVFKKWLLPCKPPKTDKDTRLMKVKVYVDQPISYGSNNSIGNSTLTMPRELIRRTINTTI